MGQTAKILPFKIPTIKKSIYSDRFIEPIDELILNKFKDQVDLDVFDGIDQDYVSFLKVLSFEELRLIYQLNKNNKIISNYVRGLGLI